MELAPIILFVYNRERHTQNCLESLLKNDLAAESEIFIYSDGAKSEEDKMEVENVRKLLRNCKGFKKINIILREENLGLARNVIDGVSEVVEKYGKIIVLEDDLIVSPCFLRFMNEGLEKYKDCERVGHIHGCEFTQNQQLPETFFIKWTGSWGWATWARAWKFFNPDGLELLRKIESENLSYEFDFDGAYGYTRMLRNQVSGKNNSWAIRWNASLFVNNILSLNCGKSLVNNTGFDGSGTHCAADNLYQTSIYQGVINIKDIPVEESLEYRKIMHNYYKKINSIPNKVKIVLKRYWNRFFKR